jgi:protein-tyrosine phosphatase
MIDFHCHALHGIDDGSRCQEESIKILNQSAQQGITVIALTPHFYGNKETPEHFLERRSAALEQLGSKEQACIPQLLAGSEVYYFPGLLQSQALSKLRLEGSPYLLLELPFTPWSDRIVDEIIELNQSKEFIVVLAHIDRYLSMQKPYVIEKFLENDVLFQANAQSFLNWRERRRMLYMVKQGCISFLGSDCHNLTSRPPCMGEAVNVIKKKLGSEAVDLLVNKELESDEVKGAQLLPR